MYLNSCDPLRDKCLFYYARMDLLFLSGQGLEHKHSPSRSQVYLLSKWAFLFLPSSYFSAFVLYWQRHKQGLSRRQSVVFSVSTDLDAQRSYKVQFGIPRLCFCLKMLSQHRQFLSIWTMFGRVYPNDSSPITTWEQVTFINVHCFLN